MNNSRRREINSLADKIRTTINLAVPMDVELAVRLLGGQLINLPPGTDPEAYVKKNGDSFIIAVIEGLKNRRRFSIAHELGHLFLHMGYIIDNQKWEKVDTYYDSVKFRYGYTEEEFEAHEFAGAFIMPEDEFRAIAETNRNGNKYSVKPIASHFKVSTDAAKIRGRWLGMFSWED